MQHDISRRTEEQKLEESVQNLLNHFVVLLFGTQEVLKQFDKVGRGDCLSDVVITTNCAY